MIRQIVITSICILFFLTTIASGINNLNDPPYEPSNPIPIDGAIDVHITTHLSWDGGDPDQGDRVTYNVYFGTESELILISNNKSGISCNPGFLDFETEYYWKITAWDNHGNYNNGPIWTFTTEQSINDPPNKPEKPSGPTGARNRFSYEYSTRTTDPNGDGLYYNYSWGDGNFSGWLGPYENNKRMWAEYEWSEPGTYQVKVKAKDGPRNETLKICNIGDESDWSDPITVIVTTEDPVNNAPNIPDINGPSTGKPGSEYDYEIVSVDPDGDDIFYHISWGCCGEEIYTFGPYNAGEQIVLSHIWPEQGDYIIQLNAEDVYGLESDWITFEISIPKSNYLMKILLDLIPRNSILYFILNKIII